MYGQVTPIFWMFIEGAYLHSRIVTNVFDSPAPFKLYYCIGWREWPFSRFAKMKKYEASIIL